MDGPNGSPYAYSMTHKKRGTFLVINNETFNIPDMPKRNGTDYDRDALDDRFSALGFDMDHYKDVTAAQMLKLMVEYADKDHSDADCFGCAILSHGEEGLVYGTDDFIEIDKLVEPFKGDRCLSLAGKPKIFIIQACRGVKVDQGVLVLVLVHYRIPTEADFIFAYATVPGFYSFRRGNGSWFIQALCKMLKLHSSTKDLMWILTRVNHEVAHEYLSNIPGDIIKHKKKQVPSIVSMLTKDVCFNVK